MFVELIIVVVLLALDQLVKVLTYTRLEVNQSVVVIDGILSFTHVQNPGAAWGMMANQRIFFISVTVVLLIAIIAIYLRIPKTKRFLLLRLTSILYFAGALGNLIDRIRFGYVVDTFEVTFIDFPVFNVADSYVVIGSFALILLTLFVYKDEELQFLKLRKNNHGEN